MASEEALLHRIARNYARCLAPIPAGLGPLALDLPPEEQEPVWAGLMHLRELLRAGYGYWAQVEAPDRRAQTDESHCAKRLEGVPYLLWAFGIAGELRRDAAGLLLWASKPALEEALRYRKVTGLAPFFDLLQRLGFAVTYLDGDGALCPQGYRRCAALTLRYAQEPSCNDPLLRALTHLARRLDLRQKLPFEPFLRGDLRPLLPGYDPSPWRYTEEEALATMDPETAALWRETAAYLAGRFPEYRPFFRAPALRRRGWVADYSRTGKGSAFCGLYGEDEGFRVRIIFKRAGRAALLGRLDELSPHMRDLFLEKTRCRSCAAACGKHEFIRIGDRLHKECAVAWFYTPHLRREDLPDIRRLLEIHAAHLR